MHNNLPFLKKPFIAKISRNSNCQNNLDNQICLQEMVKLNEIWKRKFNVTDRGIDLFLSGWADAVEWRGFGKSYFGDVFVDGC